MLRLHLKIQSAVKHHFCRSTGAITLKTQFADNLNQSQNFTIGQVSAS